MVFIGIRHLPRVLLKRSVRMLSWIRLLHVDLTPEDPSSSSEGLDPRCFEIFRFSMTDNSIFFYPAYLPTCLQTQGAVHSLTAKGR